MAQFEFYQDAKLTIWERCYFSVEADSYEQAVKKVENYRDSVIHLTEPPEFSLLSGESLFETAEYITPEDNGGVATLEIFDKKGKEVCNNSNE